MSNWEYNTTCNTKKSLKCWFLWMYLEVAPTYNCAENPICFPNHSRWSQLLKAHEEQLLELRSAQAENIEFLSSV